MNIEKFINQLEENNIQLRLDHGKVRLRGPKEKLTLELQEKIKEKKSLIVEYLERVKLDRELDLSYSQTSIWSIFQLQPDNVAYNVACALKLSEKSNIKALQMAYEGLQMRHDVLRVIFKDTQDGPRQYFHDNALNQLKIIEIEDSLNKEQIDAIISKEIDKPFNFKKDSVSRLVLLKSQNNHEILIFINSHIAVDFWSMDILLEELTKLYNAACRSENTVMPLLLKNYGDYIEQEKSYLLSKQAQSDKNFWKNQLDGDLPVLEFGYQANARRQRNMCGSTFRLPWNIKWYERIKAAAISQNVSPFSYLFSVYFLLLAKYANTKDIIIGMPTSGRSDPDNENIIGHFVNTLPVRIQSLGDETFSEWLKQCNKEVLLALEHQAYPFPVIVQNIDIDRNLDSSPVFQVMFNWNQSRQNDKENISQLLGDIVFSTSNGVKGASHDLTLTISEISEQITCIWNYSDDRFDRAFIEQLSKSYNYLIKTVIEKPDQRLDQICLMDIEAILKLNTSRKKIVLGQKNPAKLLHDIVKQQCRSTPNEIAIIDKNRSISYYELDKKSDHLAFVLQSKLDNNVNGIVSILMNRTADLIVTMLGILKTNSAYLPLDTAYPEDRLNYILSNSKADYLIYDNENTALADKAFGNKISYESLMGIKLEGVSQTCKIKPHMRQLAQIIYTSGSTGMPKGVAIEHANTVALLNWAKTVFDKDTLRGVLASSSVCFDLSIFEIFLPLISGGKCIIIENGLQLPSTPFADQLTLINTVPSVMDVLIAQNAVPSSVKTINLAGEALLRPLADRVYNLKHVEKLYNLYGPSEDTIYSTYSLVANNKDERVLIGEAVDGSSCYVLDEYGNLLPPGISGELYLTGDGVSRGYLNNPRLTAERYLPDPFSDQAGRRMYKTGDCVRIVPSGGLEYLSRNDFQVKLRGYRIELSEIEAILLKEDSVLECGVVMQKNDAIGNFLVAYIVPLNEKGFNPKYYKTILYSKLPSYMVPEVYVSLKGLPKTNSGKIDKVTLTKFTVDQPQAVQDNVADLSATGKLVSEIWKDVLNIQNLTRQDNFFKLGGHSLLAAAVTFRINQALGLDMAPNAIFDKPTLSDFIDMVEGILQESKRICSSLRVIKEPDSVGCVSFAQRGIWFESHRISNRKGESSSNYNTAVRINIYAGLDFDRLKQSLLMLSERQSNLRSVFQFSNDNIQSIILDKIDINIEELAVEESNLSEHINSFVSEALSLTCGPLFMVRVFRLSNNSFVLVFKIHHLISDGTSLRIIINELISIYQNYSTKYLPVLELNYQDFAFKQRKWLDSKAAGQQLQYWNSELKDAPLLLNMPLDARRPKQRNYNGGTLSFFIPKNISSNLLEMGRRNDVTPFMLYFSIFSILISRYSNQKDFLLGTPYSQRCQHDLENIIGLFVNLLPIRVELNHRESFREFLSTMRSKLLAAFKHSDIPFEKLIDELKIDRDQRYHPMIQSTFAYEHIDNINFTVDNDHWEIVDIPEHAAKFDLSMQLLETDEDLLCNLVFNTDIFSSATIEKFKRHWLRLLDTISYNPESVLADLSILSKSEYDELTKSHAVLSGEVSLGGVHKLFEKIAEQYGNNIALHDESMHLDYCQLNIKSNQLAALLEEKGIGPGCQVGICMNMQCNAVIAMLAVWKLQAAYVPIDSAYPVERISFICSDAQLSLLLIDKDVFLHNVDIRYDDINHLIEHAATKEFEPKHNYSADNIAYIIYTSGSSGRPKGVSVSHKSLFSLISWHQQTYHNRAGHKASQLAGFGFDAAVWEIWPYLCAGSTVYIANKITRMDPIKLINWLITNEIEYCFMSTPLAENILNNESSKHLPLKYLFTGGDRLLFSDVDGLPFCLVNHYGPTENTVVASAGVVDGTRDIPTIGKPIANTRIYILDEYLNPVPNGICGEIYLSGNALAYGYYKQASLTAQRFIPDPFSDQGGERLYRSGDIARIYNEEIEFIGRSDQQIKLRGFRVELEEIQYCIESIKEIKSSIVTLLKRNEESYIAAYIIPAVVTNDGTTQSYAELITNVREKLALQLPEYMLPSAYQVVLKFPLTENGKINYKALPDPVMVEYNQYAAPETEMERTLVKIWENLIYKSPIGVQDDFFKIGGHSLLAMQLCELIQKELMLECSITTLFENPTIKQLAKVLSKSINDKAPTADQLPQLHVNISQRYEPFPLTDIQQTYFIGRSGAYDLSDIATQVYSEVDVDDVDIKRYNHAWQSLITRHEMLRVVITQDHQQQILPEISDYTIQFVDLSGSDVNQANITLLKIRNEMNEKSRTGHKWPLFDNRITKLPNGKFRLHSLMDALIADGWSNEILTNDFMHYYLGIDNRLKPIEVSFRDYVLTEQKIKETKLYEKSKQYWLNRLDTIPGPPELPIKNNAEKHAKGRFRRRHQRLSKTQWHAIKQYAQNIKITPSILLLSAYAAVISAWSKKPQFTLNLTLFNRLPLHPHINHVVGDFTSLTLLEINRNSDDFEQFANSVQKQLLQDLEHKYFSGVEFLRERARNKNGNHEAVMPVVFTSAINDDAYQDDGKAIYEAASEIDLQQLNSDGYGVSQTSQVWLDHSITEYNGELELNWEAIDHLFEENVLDYMFDAYINLLMNIIQQKENYVDISFSALPDSQAKRRSLLNNTNKTMPELMLHELFQQQYLRDSDATAIIGSQNRITYRQAWLASGRLALQLRELGARPNQLVAVMMHKGWEQVIACLAILRSGAAYIPIDHSLPIVRQQQLLKHANASVALVQEDFDTNTVIENLNILTVKNDVLNEHNDIELKPMQSLEDLAYVIFTSGSTGIPKGVMIDHRGAVNTILDINDKFNVSHNDVILALSSLSFDLSVYDIFGMLAKGACIVLPDRKQAMSPAAWFQLIKQYKVSIFNSVPALMQLLVDYTEERNSTLNDSLRLVMMSGDWIPINLSERIRKLEKHRNNIDIISLGGATEASIWSIYYRIGEIDDEWKSIPYGVPLSNQEFCVLRKNLSPCPDWVVGDLYIGGVGLAKGYWQDKEKTDANFITHPVSGERLYRTGDLGRYMSDGNIEFLGREDAQVKIQGYRVELEEIESVLLKHSLVKQAVAHTYTDKNSNVHLAGYIVSDQENADEGILNKLDLKINKPAIIDDIVTNNTIKLKYAEQIYCSDQPGLMQNTLDRSLLGSWLACLAQYQLKDAALPKYYYPSSGGLNPIQVYIIIHGDLNSQLPKGAYYYHPVRHALVALDYVPGHISHNDASISVFFVAEMKAIEPVYHEYSEDLCHLEIGYMQSLLMRHGFALGLKNHINHFKADKVHKGLSLLPSQKCLQCISWNSNDSIVSDINAFNVTELSITSRQSFRQFDGDAENVDAISSLLDRLSQCYELKDNSLKILLYCRYSGKLFKKGFYQFQVKSSQWLYLSDIDVYPYYYSGLNVNIFQSASFCIYFLGRNADRRAENQRNIGSVSQYLMSLSSSVRLGFCPIGSMNFSELQSSLKISKDFYLLHSLIGGAITDEQLNHWHGLNNQGLSIGIEDELKLFLQSQLPAYMVPGRILKIDAIPLTLNGKVARDKLPIPEVLDQKVGNYQAPKTKIEKDLCQLWSEILNIEVVGVNNTFFELGGNSMMLIQAHTRMQDMFDREIAIVDLFNHPDIKTLAKFIAAKENDDHSIHDQLKTQADQQRDAVQRLRKRVN